VRRSRNAPILLLMGLAVLICAVPVSSSAASNAGCVARASGPGPGGAHCFFKYAGGKVRIVAAGATTNAAGGFAIEGIVQNGNFFVTNCTDTGNPAACVAPAVKPGIPKGTVLTCKAFKRHSVLASSFAWAACTSGA
jgi:hypothetical protein